MMYYMMFVLLQIKIIQQKFQFGSPYFFYPMKKFNFIATVEDIMPGQSIFHTIIFTYQDHFSVLLKKKIYATKVQIQDNLFHIRFTEFGLAYTDNGI